MTPKPNPCEKELMDRYTLKKPCVVAGEPDPYTVWLVVNQQSFCLANYQNDKESADWLRLMLAKALAVVIKENKP